MGSSSPSYINTVEYIFAYKARAEVPLWTVHAEYRGCALRDSSIRGDASVTLSLGSVAIPQSHLCLQFSIAGILISGLVTILLEYVGYEDNHGVLYTFIIRAFGA